MILDANGIPIIAQGQRVRRVTDVTKSFSYKLSLKDSSGNKTYESADFFCAMKATINPDEEDPIEVGRDLHEMCMEEVQSDIRTFQERRANKQIQRKGVIAA